MFWGTVSPHALSGGTAAGTLSLLLATQFGGFLLGVLSAPSVGARIGMRRHVTVALLLFAVALAIPLGTSHAAVLAGAGAVFGVAAGTLETQVGALALAPGRSPRALTVLEVCFGLGALLFPVYIFALSQVVSWRVLVAVLAAGALALCGAWVRSAGPRSVDGFASGNAPVDRRRDGTAARRVPTTAGVLLLVFAAVYAGFETNFANYLPRIVGTGNGTGASVLAVSGFWLGITVGRVLAAGAAAALLTRRALVVLSAALFVTLLGAERFGDDLAGTVPWVVLAGVLAAGMFPIALTLATRLGRLPVPVMTSYFVACASFGGSVLALPVGYALDAGGASGALLFFAGGAALLTILSLSSR